MNGFNSSQHNTVFSMIFMLSPPYNPRVFFLVNSTIVVVFFESSPNSCWFDAVFWGFSKQMPMSIYSEFILGKKTCPKNCVTLRFLLIRWPFIIINIMWPTKSSSHWSTMQDDKGFVDNQREFQVSILVWIHAETSNKTEEKDKRTGRRTEKRGRMLMFVWRAVVDSYGEHAYSYGT